MTAYDDGRRENEWGSDGIDDEGTPTQRTTIIEDGRLTSYLYDLLRARKDGVGSTGNGRRESFRHLPMPRMTNTFFAPGDATPDDLIAEVERGLYAVSFGGGQVEPATGDFVFGVSEGYLIEDGKVTAPVRGATLVGNGLEALRRDRRDRRRPRHRHRLLRQGRPDGARRRRPAARAHPRADRGRHRRVSARPRPSRRRAVDAALAAGAERRRGAGPRSPTSRRIRVYEGEVESLSDAGGARRRACAPSPAPAAATPTAPTSPTQGLARVARAAREAARGGRRGRVRAACPTSSARATVDGLASPGAAPAGRTERKVELALAVERAARAREGVTQVENAVYSDADGSRGARQLARLRGLVRAPPRHGPTRRRSRARAPT